MTRNKIALALIAALAAGSAAAEHSYDDRVTISAKAGMAFADTDRNTDDGFYWGVGIGKFFTEKLSLDLEYDNYGMDFERSGGVSWENQALGLTGRYHFGEYNPEAFRPFVGLGLGYVEHDIGLGSPNQPVIRDTDSNNLFFQIGTGFTRSLTGRVSLRGEIGYRYDMDGDSLADQDEFGDWLASFGLTIALGPDLDHGPAPVATDDTPAPAPRAADPAPPAAPADGDRDGVVDADDRCPDSRAGQAIGPDGCPVQVAIDLRGVNFDFDKSNLRPDAIDILDQAVTVLKQYADVQVEVAGHTDAIGTDAYNQGLSDRRAAAVREYLIANGIAAERLRSAGYGESQPIDSNDTAEGRARNRRTELRILN